MLFSVYLVLLTFSDICRGTWPGRKGAWRAAVGHLSPCSWLEGHLLDEADVFVQSRSFVNPYNALVSVFLRTLEYYQGIMILTTNRVKDIDDAIQNRISVELHYGPLGLDTRKTIWESFLKKTVRAKGGAKYTSADLDWLSRKELNGRPVCCWANICDAALTDPQCRSKTWSVLLMPSLSTRRCHCRDRIWKSSSTLTRNFRKITIVQVRWRTKRLTSSIVTTVHALATKKNSQVAYFYVQQALKMKHHRKLVPLTMSKINLSISFWLLAFVFKWHRT